MALNAALTEAQQEVPQELRLAQDTVPDAAQPTAQAFNTSTAEWAAIGISVSKQLPARRCWGSKTGRKSFSDSSIH